VVRGTATPPDEWSKSDYRGFGLALYFPAKGLGIDMFILHQDDQIQFRKEIKQLQGFFAAVCGKDVEFAGFKNQLSCGKGLSRFRLRHQQCWSRHLQVDEFSPEEVGGMVSAVGFRVRQLAQFGVLSDLRQTL